MFETNLEIGVAVRKLCTRTILSEMQIREWTAFWDLRNVWTATEPGMLECRFLVLLSHIRRSARLMVGRTDFPVTVREPNAVLSEVHDAVTLGSEPYCESLYDLPELQASQLLGRRSTRFDISPVSDPIRQGFWTQRFHLASNTLGRSLAVAWFVRAVPTMPIMFFNRSTDMWTARTFIQSHGTVLDLIVSEIPLSEMISGDPERDLLTIDLEAALNVITTVLVSVPGLDVVNMLPRRKG